jgi:putative endonuclease
MPREPAGDDKAQAVPRPAARDHNAQAAPRSAAGHDSAQAVRRSPSAADRRRATGRLGEQHAAAHLRRLGFSVLARNARTREGEIDLVAFDGAVLAFVEVKSTRRGNAGVAPEPLERLGPRQRARLRRLALEWLAEQQGRPRAETIRFDAIGVVLDSGGRLQRLDHVEGAW